MVHSIDKIVDFVQKYSPYKDPELIAGFIQQHLEYHTGLVIHDNDGEVVAVCRWNIEDSGRVATVLDLIIRPDRRNKGFIKKILQYGLTIWPTVKVLRWQREWKYKDAEKNYWRIRSVKEF